MPSFPGRNDLCKLYEELEWGQYLNLNNLDKITVTKLYSENINDTLWIKIDKQNITFEEICDNFDVYANAIVTQVIHLEYIKEDNEFFITHLDHEYIFYTEDEYLKRESDINQKGTAKPRMKSFKIDNARIPLNYKVEIKRRDVDNVSWIVQTEPFLLYVLDLQDVHNASFRENYAGNCFTHTRLVVCCKRHAVPMFSSVVFLPVMYVMRGTSLCIFFTTADTEAFKFFPVIPCVRCDKIVTLH